METSFNLCNLEGRKKVLSCSISFFNFPPHFNTFVLQITPQRLFWGIPRASSENESIAVMWKWGIWGYFKGSWGARDGLYVSLGQFGKWGEDDSLLLYTCGGEWRQVAKLQIFFSKIFWLKLFSHPAVMNTSFSGQVISMSAELRKKSFLPPIFPKENLC